MSLDVYLRTDHPTERIPSSGIFVREDGRTVEITREEWNERYPDREPVMFNIQREDDPCVFRANITHSLTGMAANAGLYKALWRPEEIGIEKASDLIPLLEEGLNRLKADPVDMKTLNPSNGWGSYEGLVNFVEDYLYACKEHPAATVEVSR